MGSYRAVARKHKIADNTVKRVCNENPETTQKIAQKKEQNTADILAYMDGKKKDVCDIIGLYLAYLQDPKKLDRASVQSIATSLGIVIDKFTQGEEKKPETEMFSNIVKATGGKFETD